MTDDTIGGCFQRALTTESSQGLVRVAKSLWAQVADIPNDELQNVSLKITSRIIRVIFAPEVIRSML
jgi:hypothetical protein